MGVFKGNIGEGMVRYWPLRNSFFVLGVFTSVPIFVKIDQEMHRESARRRTDTLTDWHTDRLTDANRFYNLSHAICYSYGTDNKMSVLLVIYGANVTCYSALNVCSVELLLKIGTLLMEMLSYEKTLDSFIELLRKDEVSLRTNFSTDCLPCVGPGHTSFPSPCPFTFSSFALFNFPFLSLALPIFFFCPSLPFLPE